MAVSSSTIFPAVNCFTWLYKQWSRTCFTLVVKRLSLIQFVLAEERLSITIFDVSVFRILRLLHSRKNPLRIPLMSSYGTTQ